MVTDVVTDGLIKFTRRKMSEENPFAGRMPKTGSGLNQSKPAGIVAGIMAGLLADVLRLGTSRAPGKNGLVAGAGGVAGASAMKTLPVGANLALPGGVFRFPIKVRPATLEVGRLGLEVFSFAIEVLSPADKVLRTGFEVL